MNELLLIKSRIEKESISGDVLEACRNAGVSSNNLFYLAIKKTSISDLTRGELSVIMEFKKILDKRNEEKESLMNP